MKRSFLERFLAFLRRMFFLNTLSKNSINMIVEKHNNLCHKGYNS